MNWPRVTVYTLIYNTDPNYIIESIVSIRANSYPNLQHIIVDDCSPNTWCKEAIKQWISEQNYPCEFVDNEQNLGICKTLNKVLSMATGKYICGCCDDAVVPHKFFTEVKLLESLGPEYAATYADAYLMDENSQLLEGRFISKYRTFKSMPDEWIFEDLTGGNFLPAMGMMWRTEYLISLGAYDEGLKFEDFDMHLRMFKKYKVKYIPEPLAKYRIHTNSLTHTLSNWSYDFYRMFKKHLEHPKLREECNKILCHILLYSESKTEFKRYGVPFPGIWFKARQWGKASNRYIRLVDWLIARQYIYFLIK
jgi:glycosyltransferase involved in cell wall biosynthesis